MMNDNPHDATIITTKVRVPAALENQFIDWQSKLNTIIVSFPGFISLEIASPTKGSSCEWAIVQRFSTPELLAKWRESKEHQELLQGLRLLLINPHIDIEEFSLIPQNLQEGTMEIFVAQVAPGKEDVYRQWTAKIHQVEARFPGFRGVYVQSPTNGHGRNWITLLQFDSQANLDRWLASPERAEILKTSESLVDSIENHRVISPYAGWFTSLEKNGEAPKVWKQTMLVLLVLFPIVMLEIKYLSLLTKNLNPSLANFIGNAISVSLISWPMMPIAIWFLGWWLLPQDTKKKQTNSLGLGLILLLYLIEIVIFWNFL